MSAIYKPVEWNEMAGNDLQASGLNDWMQPVVLGSQGVSLRTTFRMSLAVEWWCIFHMFQFCVSEIPR